MSDQLPGRGASTAEIRRHRAGKEIHRANDIAQVGIARATIGAAPSRPSRATEGRSLLSGLTLRPSQQRAPSGAESEAIPGAGAGEGRIWTGTAGFQTSGVAVILDLVDAQIGLSRGAGDVGPGYVEIGPSSTLLLSQRQRSTARRYNYVPMNRTSVGRFTGKRPVPRAIDTARPPRSLLARRCDQPTLLLPGRRAHRLRSVIGPTPVDVRNDHDVTMAP